MVIYCIKNKINSKIYIGQTRLSLKKRIKQHLVAKSFIGKALRKYGVSTFDISIIYNAKNLEDLNNKEIFYIKKYNSIGKNGYNLDSGGKEKLPSCSTILKQRNSAKKRQDLDLLCQITKVDTGFRLRAIVNEKRIHLGNFKNEKDAIKYYKYCKKINKFEKIILPRVSNYKNNKYRLRITKNGKRVCLGFFDTKKEALDLYYKENYNGYA